MPMLRVILLALLAFVTPAQAKPNIILILTDDQTTDSYAHMPFLQSVVNQALVLKQYYHSLALCCPSRTSMFTGMLPHNHGVLGNTSPDGGYSKFASLELELKTWGKLLSDNGYHTAMLGKFLNQYHMKNVPAGWTHWFAGFGQGLAFNYEVNKNGAVVSYGDGDNNYFTNVLSDEAHGLINRQADDGRPLAILFSPTCPHHPSIPAYAYAGIYQHEPFTIADKPSFNELDVSDKPAYIRDLPVISAGHIRGIKKSWRKRLECARSIDDAFRRMWNDLEATGQLGNTYFFLTTDNGLMRGEHRIQANKVVPYQESISSTLFIWGPAIEPRTDNKHIAANVDFMPTFAELAGLKAPAWTDGRSLVPLFDNNWARKAFLVQGLAGSDAESGTSDASGRHFLAYVTSAYVYVKHAGSPDREFYDMIADPYQLTNRASTLAPSMVAEIEARIGELNSCAGHKCRIYENAIPPAARK